MKNIQLLWELQQLDNRILDIKKECGITDLRRNIEEYKEKYNKLLQATKKKAEEYKEKDAIATALKEEIAKSKENILKWEEELESGQITKQKAINQLKKDIEDNKALLEENKKNLQELRKANITIIKQIKKCKAKLEHLKESVDASENKISLLEAEKAQEFEEIRKKQEEISKRLEPEDYKYYYEKKENIYPVLVAYTGDSCEGCKVQFSIMFTQNIEKNNLSYAICENCGRIVVVGETQEA